MIIQTVTHIHLAKYRILELPNLHIHCLCHIINLVVQTILAVLREADDPDDIDYYTLNKEQPLHLDIGTDPEQCELDKVQYLKEMDEDEDENVVLEEEEKLKAMASPLAKVSLLPVAKVYFTSSLGQLHQITIKIVSTPQCWQKFQKCAIEKYSRRNSEFKDRQEGLAVVRDVHTHWNYTHAMIH